MCLDDGPQKKEKLLKNLMFLADITCAGLDESLHNELVLH